MDMIKKREDELNEKFFQTLESIPNIKVLAPNHKERLSIFSFYVENIHFNLVVKLLNDRYGIQTRGGCSCAGTYGHFLLNVDQVTSNKIKNQILDGCSTEKPGWVRISMHPTIKDSELEFISNSLVELCENIHEWSKDYTYDSLKNDYVHKSVVPIEKQLVKNWFEV